MEGQLILTADEIVDRGIVAPPTDDRKRGTTYDATIGDIIVDGAQFDGQKYDLPPRGLVWVVSAESFKMPNNITGLATLRTSWTHDGILALNVGVIDPNYHGPLATCLVNFSNNNFPIEINDTFFRVIFFENRPSDREGEKIDRKNYRSRILDKAKKTPPTFMNISAISRDVLEQIFTFPKLVNWLAALGILVATVSFLVAIIAVTVPVAYSVNSDFVSMKMEIQQLKTQVEDLESKLKAKGETGARPKNSGSAADGR